MRIGIIGKKGSGKTHFAKELIKKTEIKNLLWITDKIDEVPLLEDYPNLKDIFFMQEVGTHSYRMTNEKMKIVKSHCSWCEKNYEEKDVIIVVDVSTYGDGFKSKIFEIVEENNNIIISIPDDIEGIEEKIKNFDEIYNLDNKYQCQCI